MKQLTALASIPVMVLLLAGLQDARAQLHLDVAPHVGYGLRVPNEVGDWGSLSVGLQGYLTLKSFDWGALILNPDVDYYLTDIEDVNGYQLDGNLLLALFYVPAVINPYLGVGVAFTNVTGNDAFTGIQEGSDVGLNLIGGLFFGAGYPRVFFQGRFTLADHNLYFEESFDPTPGTGFGVQGGILFKLSD